MVVVSAVIPLVEPPNIVKLKEVIRENNEFYFVFEYLVRLLFFVS